MKKGVTFQIPKSVEDEAFIHLLDYCLGQAKTKIEIVIGKKGSFLGIPFEIVDCNPVMGFILDKKTIVTIEDFPSSRMDMDGLSPQRQSKLIVDYDSSVPFQDPIPIVLRLDAGMVFDSDARVGVSRSFAERHFLSNDCFAKIVVILDPKTMPTTCNTNFVPIKAYERLVKIMVIEDEVVDVAENYAPSDFDVILKDNFLLNLNLNLNLSLGSLFPVPMVKSLRLTPINPKHTVKIAKSVRISRIWCPRILDEGNIDYQSHLSKHLRKYGNGIPFRIGDVFSIEIPDSAAFIHEEDFQRSNERDFVFLAHFKISDALDQKKTPLIDEDFLIDCLETHLYQQGLTCSQISHDGFKSKAPIVIGNSTVVPFISPNFTLLPNAFEMEFHQIMKEIKDCKGEKSRILLVGHQGSGRRHMAMNIAKAMFLHYYEVNWYDLPEKNKRENWSFSNLDPLEYLVLCIPDFQLFLDEGKSADSVSDAARQDDFMEQRKVKDILMELEAFQSNVALNGGKCIIILTVKPEDRVYEWIKDWIKDSSQIKLNVPNFTQRREILAKAFTPSESIFVENISKNTAGFSLSEIIALIMKVKMTGQATRLKLQDDLSGKVSKASTDDSWAEVEGILQSMKKAHQGQKSSSIQIPTVKWDQVGGMESVKEEILKCLVFPLQFPHLFTDGARSRSGVLLYGPPGTGKTLLAKAIATECGMNFMSVKGPELLNMYIGESEANVRKVFEKARNASPCVVFFDELDSLAPQRGRSSDMGSVMDRMVSQMLSELDGAHRNDSNVFVIGATNRPDLLDSALLGPGRFEKLIYVGIPKDLQTKKKVLSAQLKHFLDRANIDLDEIVSDFDPRYSNADISAVATGAINFAIGRKLSDLKQLGKLQDINTLSEDDLRIQLCNGDFKEATKTVFPSVTNEKQYQLGI